jgi:hypothetical protein
LETRVFGGLGLGAVVGRRSELSGIVGKKRK